MKINIVMVEPEIPQNTGNIARTCAAIGAKLHLVYPLGFEITDKYLKRAGLDYWDKLEIEEHKSLKEFLEKYKPQENAMFFATTKGQHCYSDVKYAKYDEVFILFGKETKGLPEELLQKYIRTSGLHEHSSRCHRETHHARRLGMHLFSKRHERGGFGWRRRI